MVRPPAVAIRDLLDFGGSGDLEKFHGLPGPEPGQKHQKSGFSWSWGPFWAKRPPTKFDRILNADPVNPVRGPMCSWDPRYGRWGGGGGRHFVDWGPVLSVVDATKRNSNPKKRGENVGKYNFRCGSNEPIFVENGAILAPGAPYRGRARTEKT